LKAHPVQGSVLWATNFAEAGRGVLVRTPYEGRGTTRA
jgi:hypothetical protein